MRWRSPSQKINGNSQSEGEKFFKQQAIKELNEEYGWPISTLSEIADITRGAYYKLTHRKTNIHEAGQAELLKAILELEEKHKWTLGYLGVTTQLAFENKLSFKAGLKRVTNCMRNHGIKTNVRKKKYNRIKRHEEYINDNLLNEQFDRQSKNEVWVIDTTEVL